MPELASNRAVVVFDLDGTILSINSFRLWVRQMIAGRFPGMPIGRRIALSQTALQALIARKAGLISHETLKWGLQRRWQKATRGDGGAGEEAFVQRLCGYVRPELAAVLAAVAEARLEAVLATAAAADYAEAFGRLLGFSHILATPRLREAGTPSLVGARKRDAVLAHLARLGWQHRPITFFTDHVDDLPLIQRSRTVYWYGEEEERCAIAAGLRGISLLPGRRAEEFLSSMPAPSDRS